MTVTCLTCGTVAFEVTRKHAGAEVKRFNEYFATLTQQEQEKLYGGKGSSIRQYERCGCGNFYKNFRDSKPGDCPDGCTLSPIIARSE